MHTSGEVEEAEVGVHDGLLPHRQQGHLGRAGLAVHCLHLPDEQQHLPGRPQGLQVRVQGLSE